MLRTALLLALVAACTPHPNGRGCPAGAFKNKTAVEDVYAPEYCVRPDGTRDGPFFEYDFDFDRNTRSTRQGSYRDGKLAGQVIVRDAANRLEKIETWADGELVAVERYAARSIESREEPGRVRLQRFDVADPPEIRDFSCQDGAPIDLEGDPRPPAIALELLSCAP